MGRPSKRTLKHLDECHPALKAIALAVMEHDDCTALDGARTIEEQRKNVDRGVSKTMDSQHIPPADREPPEEMEYGNLSTAMDLAPYPIRWANVYRLLKALPADQRAELFDLMRFCVFSGRVLGTADQMRVVLRWGGDWDRDTELNDQSFYDLNHFELVGEPEWPPG